MSDTKRLASVFYLHSLATMFSIPSSMRHGLIDDFLTHRGYSHLAIGRVIQTRLFADRNEIQSAGSLFSLVRVETIPEQQTTRNPALAESAWTSKVVVSGARSD